MYFNYFTGWWSDRKNENKSLQSKWEWQRYRKWEKQRDRSLVCFDVNSKSTVPVVLGSSRWVNAESKSVYEILQVMLTDQNAAGFPCYVSNVFWKHIMLDVDKYLPTDRAKTSKESIWGDSHQSKSFQFLFFIILLIFFPLLLLLLFLHCLCADAEMTVFLYVCAVV